MFLKTLPIEQIVGNLNADFRMLLWLFFWTNWRQNRNYWDFNLCIWCVKRLHNDRDSDSYALALDNLMPFSRQFQKLSKRFVVPYVARNFSS